MGRNLEKKGIFGKVDAYVQCKIEEKILRTETVANNQNPEWNYSNRIHLQSEEDTMEITVFDDDIGRDDFLGDLSVNIKEKKNIIEQWIPLQNCKSGEILLRIADHHRTWRMNTESFRRTWEAVDLCRKMWTTSSTCRLDRLAKHTRKLSKPKGE